MARNPVFHACSKHIEIDYHFVREQLVASTLDVRYVRALDQIANVLIKAVPSDFFLYLKDKLHVFPSPFHL